MHDDSTLGFACADVVEGECSVCTDGCEDGGFGGVEADGGDCFGGGGEGEVGDCGGFGFVPDLDNVGGGCEEGVCSVVVY